MSILTNRWNRFRRAQEGVAYLEFAIALPFLLTMFMGAVELTRYILITQKVEKVSMTVSDLVAQSSDITSAELDVLIQAAGQVMQPYSFSTTGYVIISSVTKTGSSAPVVNWQYKGGGTWTKASKVGSTGTAATLPSGFTMVDKENVIFSEVFYNYTPLMGGKIGNVMVNTQMYRVSVFRPRLGNLTVLGMFMPTIVKGAFL